MPKVSRTSAGMTNASSTALLPRSSRINWRIMTLASSEPYPHFFVVARQRNSIRVADPVENTERVGEAEIRRHADERAYELAGAGIAIRELHMEVRGGGR